ncbi:tetratricopeptide repeat protein [Streptomyces sp. NPDC058297]|uniref:tetratricopeptide repeat protein n=1 Tax=Streptomyces sp. NPDC058297 TaxID=3346433 RepID=UPI0036E43250
MLGVALFTIGPAVLNVLKLPGPKWATTAVAALGGVLLLVATPLFQARMEGLTERTRLESERAQQQADALEPLAATDGNLPRVRDVTDRSLLRIHPAIPLTSDSNPELSPTMPTYVPRDIDLDLQAALRAAGAAGGGFILLIGPAASGKTRCAYEAIRATLPDWRMCLPTNANQITDLVNAGTDLSRTVLWLDDTQRFIGPGKIAPRTVRQLLADPTNPTILIGTMWPGTYESLIGIPLISSADEGDWDSKDLLSMAQRFTLAKFSESEHDRASLIARTDPRIMECLAHEQSGNAISVLAASPELIRRREHASDHFGAAALEAGIISRLCGHPEPIPRETLERLATSLLTGTQRAEADEGWFTLALEWACHPIRGDIAPLRPDASTIGRVDGYCVTDVLIQYAQDESQHVQHESWNLIIENSTGDVCLSVGDAAHENGHEATARRAWLRSAESGSPHAMAHLGTSMIISGEIQAGRSWLRSAIRTDPEIAPYSLGCFLILRGAREEGHAWITEWITPGDGRSAALAGLSLIDDAPDEGNFWLNRAVECGIPAEFIGTVLFGASNLEQGRRWLEFAHQDGSDPTLIAEMLLQQGNTDEAMEWFDRAIQTGGATSAMLAGISLFQAGEPGKGRILLERAVQVEDDADSPREMRIGVNGLMLAGLLGEVDEGKKWLERAIEEGSTDAAIILENLPSLMRDVGEKSDP